MSDADFRNLVEKPVMEAARYLRSHVTAHEGIMADKRVELFRGTAAIKVLQSPGYERLAHAGKVPVAKTAQQCEQLLTQLLDYGFFIRASRAGTTAGAKPIPVFEPDVGRDWSDSAVYAWIYTGSQWRTVVGAILLFIVAMTLVLFPLWPTTLRTGVWYLGMLALGFLGFLMVLAIVRVILFAITAIAMPPGIWLFPNLFEDVGFFESFVPLWAWHTSSVDTSTAAKKSE